jgi:hypothetical protein
MIPINRKPTHGTPTRGDWLMRVRMLDASGYRDYRYLIEDVDRHGNIRIYFRLKKRQPKIRLKALPGTEEFDTEYRRALTAKLRPPAEAASAGDNVGGPAKPGTLRWLCQQYLASKSFNGQAGQTRRLRRAALDWVCQQKFGKEKAADRSRGWRRSTSRHCATRRRDQGRPTVSPTRCAPCSLGQSRPTTAMPRTIQRLR